MQAAQGRPERDFGFDEARLPPSLPPRATGTEWNKLAYSWRTWLVDTLLSRSRTHGPHFQDSVRLPVNPVGVRARAPCAACTLVF